MVEVPKTAMVVTPHPDDAEISLLLDKVYPAHEVVKIDYHLPGTSQRVQHQPVIPEGEMWVMR